jgi:hypothetical protein
MEYVTKRYAFLVENEIFDIMPMKGSYQEPFFLRWSDGFSNEPKILNLDGPLDVSIGSTWDGESFDSSTLPEERIIYKIQSDRQVYPIINKENVVFMIMELTESPPLLKNAYEAAFSTGNVVPMDITDFPVDVSYEWTWDGENFLPPEES